MLIVSRSERRGKRREEREKKNKLRTNGIRHRERGIFDAALARIRTDHGDEN